MASKSENQAVLRGREAWERLKKDLTWEDWMLAGIAFDDRANRVPRPGAHE